MLRKTFLILTLAILLMSAAVLAQPEYAVDWWAIDGGGGVASGGSFSLQGSIGQADSGTLAGGGFDLQGGFWGHSGYSVHLPLITD